MNQLHFSRLGRQPRADFSKIFTGENSFPADGYGYYDIHLKFVKASQGKYFDNGCVTYQIAGPGLDASDFAFLDAFGGCTGFVLCLGSCPDHLWRQ